MILLAEVSTGGNSFSGPIPSTFGTQIVYLENSNFSQNLLSGSIPPSIFSLKMLQILDLHGNSLNQSIPWNLTQFTALQIPSLSSNEFSGSIPTGIGDTVNPTSVCNAILLCKFLGISFDLTPNKVGNFIQFQFTFVIPSQIRICR